MLKTRQDWSGTKELAAARMFAAGVIMAIGALTFVAGGWAQTSEPGAGTPASPVTRVARAVPRGTIEKVDPTMGMFQRGVMDPRVIPANKLGMIKVRLADILARPEVAPMEAMINRLSAEALKRAFESPELPTFDLSSIDMVFGTTQLSTRHRPEVEGPKNSLQIGVSDMQVRFKNPADVSDWLEKFAPATKESLHQGRSYYTLPLMPALGPAPIAVANRDLRTVCFSNMFWRGLTDVDDPAQIASLAKSVKHQVQPNASLWAEAFCRVDGGLFTYAVTSEEIRTPEEFQWIGVEDSRERATREAGHRIEHTFETLAVGLDVSEDGNQVGIRIRVGCSNRADTETIAADLRLLHRMGLQWIADSESASETDENADELTAVGKELSKQFMERMVFGLVDHSDGSSDVYIRTALSYPSVMGAFAQMVVSEFVVDHENETLDRASAK